MTRRPNRRQPTVTVRAERGQIVIKRPGSANFTFPPEDVAAALEFAKKAAKLFGASIVLDGVEEAGR